MAELILVKAANPERVALWERHADHPDTEVYVAGEDAVLVALTPLVDRKLKQGVLLRIEPAQAPTEETPVDDAPVTEETPAPKTKKAK